MRDRKPTSKQVDTLIAIRDHRPVDAKAIWDMTDRGWVSYPHGMPVLTAAGERVIQGARDLADLAAIPSAERPNITLRKRRNGRRWLGWEVLCFEGCPGGYFNTPKCVWATNDHAARDKHDAEHAYARHILKHIRNE